MRENVLRKKFRRGFRRIGRAVLYFVECDEFYFEKSLRLWHVHISIIFMLDTCYTYVYDPIKLMLNIEEYPRKELLLLLTLIEIWLNVLNFCHLS